MKLGISAWRLYGQRLGIGRYIEYMLKHWNKMLEPNDRVTLFVHEPLKENYLNLSDAFSVQVIKPKLTNALWENLLLPKYAKGQDRCCRGKRLSSIILKGFFPSHRVSPSNLSSISRKAANGSRFPKFSCRETSA